MICVQAEAAAAKKGAFSKKEQKAIMKQEKKASGAGLFRSGKGPEWKPVFFTGLDNAPLKKSTCCGLGSAKESEEEVASRMFLCDLMLMSMVYKPVYDCMSGKIYKKTADKAARELMIVHALNKGVNDYPPALFREYPKPMDAFVEFERRFIAATRWMEKQKDSHLAEFYVRKKKTEGRKCKGSYLLLKLGGDSKVMNACRQMFINYGEGDMFSHKNRKKTIWHRIEAPKKKGSRSNADQESGIAAAAIAAEVAANAPPSLTQMGKDHVQGEMKGAIEGQAQGMVNDALGFDAFGGGESKADMATEFLQGEFEGALGAELDIPEFPDGLMDCIEGLDDMIGALDNLEALGGLLDFADILISEFF